MLFRSTIIIDKQTNNASDKDINDAHQILFKNNPSISILFEIIMPYFDIIRLIIVLSIFAYHGLYIEFMGQEKKVPESIGFISFVFTFLTIIIGFLLDGIVSMQCHKLKDHETRTFNIGLMNHYHCASFFYVIYNFAIILLFLKPNSYVFLKN